MSPTTTFSVLQAMPSRGELALSILNGIIGWGLSFFGALAAMAFAQVRVDPQAAVWGAMMPALVVFFVRLQQGVEASDGQD